MANGPVIGEVLAPTVQESSSISTSVPATEIAPLPAGFPALLKTGLAWSGSDFQESDYVYHLSHDDVKEIGVGLAHFKSLGLDGGLVNRQNFPLPKLGPKLDALSREVHHGKGFCLIRGIDPSAYGVEDITLVYLGVQGYIADLRGRQDKRGNMLVHIVANPSVNTANHHRHSNKAITFHTEETGDVVGWLTRSTAASGGKCIIASAHTVYNVLAQRRPDMIRTLTRADWPFAFPKFQCRPIIFYENSRLIMNFGRAPLLGNAAHPRPGRLPAVTPKQEEALDAIEAIARATEVEIQTQAGDMHFINNLAILHRRESFVDGAAEKRHLVRMRLRSSQHGWMIPTPLQSYWHAAFDEGEERVWHPEPKSEAYFPLRKYPN